MKPGRGHNKKYMEWIRGQICIVCRRPAPSEPHHFTQRGHGGMGTKCPDTRCIPLCREHHAEVHQSGRNAFIDRYTMGEESVEGIIRRLNQVWEEYNAKH